MSAADDVLDTVLAEYAVYETDGESGWVDMRRMVAEIVRLRAIEAAALAVIEPSTLIEIQTLASVGTEALLNRLVRVCHGGPA